MTGTPLAWYGSSFAYYEPEPEPEPVDLREIAREERRRRRSEFGPEWFGPEPGTGDRIGVVLGRFLPVHEGHRFLIGFAVAYAKDVVVVVRVGPDDPYPFAQREGWLRELFPAVRVVAMADDGDFPPPTASGRISFESRWAERIRSEVKPAYVFASESYGHGLAGRMHARYVPVDPARRVVPISGTEIRADPWARPEFLPPCVRGSLVRRVCVIGPESTGKTRLVERLATHYGTTYVEEFARSILGREGRAWQAADTTTIAKAQQVAEESMARRATRVLFSDTNLFGVGLWSERLFGQAPPWVVDAADATDLYLLTEPDVPYQGDPTYDEPEERAEFHARCVAALTAAGKEFAPIRGGYEERFARAVDAVDALLRP
jgi:HTH-type transcriptional repressor of NAD biosynthesis genes